MKRRIAVAAWLLAVTLACAATAQADTKRAAGHHAGNAAGGNASGAPHQGNDEAGPRLAAGSDAWAHRTVFVILGLFVAAAVIGPIVRSEVPEEVPVATTHDEPLPAHHHDGTAESSHIGPSHGHGGHGGHGTGGHH